MGLPSCINETPIPFPRASHYTIKVFLKSRVGKTRAWHVDSLIFSKDVVASRLQKMRLRCCYFPIIHKKIVIIPCQLKKSLKMLKGCGDFPLFDGFNFVRIYLNTLMRYNMTKKFHLLYTKNIWRFLHIIVSPPIV